MPLIRTNPDGTFAPVKQAQLDRIIAAQNRATKLLADLVGVAAGPAAGPATPASPVATRKRPGRKPRAQAADIDSPIPYVPTEPA